MPCASHLWRMPRLHLKVEIGADEDNWLAALSTDFPAARFKVLSSNPTDNGVLEITEVTASDVDAIVHRFDEAPEKRSFDVLHSEEGMGLIQYVFPMPASYEARLATESLPRFPITIQDGWISGELFGSHEQLSQLTARLAATETPFEVVSLTQSYEPSALLTQRQWEFVTEAVERGYYDSPRRCTLLELAEAFEVNQSAASGVLHRAEGRIITKFIEDASSI